MFWLVFQTFNTFVNPPTHKVESHNLIEVVIFSWSPSFPLTPCKLFGKKCTLHKMPLVHANQSRHIQQLFELKLPLQSNWFIWSTVEFSTQTSYVGRNPCALPPFTSTAKLWHYGKNNFLICSLRVMVCCQSWEYCYYSSAAFRYCPWSLESGEDEWLNVFQFKTSYFAITKFFRNRDNRQQRYFFRVCIRWISLNAGRYLLIGKALFGR